MHIHSTDSSPSGDEGHSDPLRAAAGARLSTLASVMLRYIDNKQSVFDELHVIPVVVS